MNSVFHASTQPKRYAIALKSQTGKAKTASGIIKLYIRIKPQLQYN